MVNRSEELFTLAILFSILLKSESFVLSNATLSCLPRSVTCKCESYKEYSVTHNNIYCDDSSSGVFPDFSVVSLTASDIWYVGVTNYNLTYVAGGVFAGFTPYNSNVTILYLDLRENRISKIENNAFLGMENMDLEIDLRNNYLIEVPFAFLMLNQLSGLALQFNPIKIIDPIILQHIAPTVTYIDLGISNFSSWPAWLSSFTNLQAVWLYGVHQNELPQRPFYGIEKKLSDVMIYASDLTMLPCWLTNLMKLYILTIQHSPNLNATNLIEECRPNYTMSIDVLHLVEGALTEFPDILKYTPRLSTLNLYRNQIQHVNEDFIPVNNLIFDLMLSYNRLKTIPNSFLRFQHLRTLILDNNDIATVEPALERVLYPGLSLCLRDNPVNTTNLTSKCSSSRGSWVQD